MFGGGKYPTSAEPGTTVFPKQYRSSGGALALIHTVLLLLSTSQTVRFTEVEEIHSFWKVCSLAITTSRAFLY